MTTTWTLCANTTWVLCSSSLRHNVGVVLNTTSALHLVLMGLDV